MPPNAGGKARRTWNGLTARPRDLLRSAFRADQAAEACEEERQRLQQEASKSLYRKSRPASEWRWINRQSALGRLRPRGTDEAGFAELAGLGLIETDAAARVRLTRSGRAAARAGTGTPPPRRRPRGLLNQWSWAALARLHAAGDGGLVIGTSANRVVPHWERCPSWNTVVRMRNRKIPYVEEIKVHGEWSVRLTSAGRDQAHQKPGIAAICAPTTRRQAASPDRSRVQPRPGGGSPASACGRRYLTVRYPACRA